MAKKTAAAFIFILLLFAGIIALTQETDGDLPIVNAENEFVEGEEYFPSEEKMPLPEWVKGARWFRSNAGGMALEEIPSRLTALRNEYALLIDIAEKEELPEYILPFYNESFFIEIRVLYKNREQERTQWIFRDTDGKTRLVAVFYEEKAEKEAQTEAAKETLTEVTDEILTEVTDEMTAEEKQDSTILIDLIADNMEKGKNSISGFIEAYDENSLITAEYRFLQDGGRSRTDYDFKNGILLSSKYLLWEGNDVDGEYKHVFTDYFRYNRSSFLRSVQRVFYKDSEISSLDDPVVITFPAGIMAAAKNGYFIGESHNSYPDFFGEITAEENTKMVYSTDERGRILSQTYFDSDDKIIWIINNTWKDDRIVSTVKEEGGNVILAEFEYDSDGDRVLERNYTNGILERVVRSEGKTDIEELYLNGNVILQAVWEDGRKVSETRMR